MRNNVYIFRPSEHDQFRIKVTVDVVDTNGSLQSDQVKNALYDPIERNHRIGDFTALPEELFFREFGGNNAGYWIFCHLCVTYLIYDGRTLVKYINFCNFYAHVLKS